MRGLSQNFGFESNLYLFSFFVFVSCKYFQQDFNKISSTELGVVVETKGILGDRFLTKAISKL